MRKTLLSTLALALLLGGASRLQADDLKPVAVISIGSYNTLSADLTFIGQVIDMPQLSKQLEAASAQAKGLDKTKPIGVAVMLDAAGKPQVVAFIGSTDLKALLSSLPFPPTDKGDGSFEINSPYGPVPPCNKAVGPFSPTLPTCSNRFRPIRRRCWAGWTRIMPPPSGSTSRMFRPNARQFRRHHEDVRRSGLAEGPRRR